MKNRILKYSIVAVLAFQGLTSCEKKLDIKPTQSIDETDALKTSSDVEAALIGAYSDLGDADVYGGSLGVVAELLAGTDEIEFGGTFETYLDIYNKSIPVNSTQVSFAWMDPYRVINDVNNVLSALDVVLPAKKNKVEGEAKFLRGAMYFELVRLFAKPYNLGTPSANDGVPLVLTPTRDPSKPENFPSRAKVSAVYDQVIKDLTEAENLLPDAGENRFYADKIAAAAMLSRVYLQKGDFINAREAANRAIQGSAGVYNLANTYADAFPYNDANTTALVPNTEEDIFAIQVSNTDGVNDFNTYFSPFGRGDIGILNGHMALYEPNDERQDLFYTASGTRYTGKFDMVYGNVHIIRLAEMYLTRAEANFRLGTNVGDDPLDDINLIRDRVGLTAYTLPQLTIEKILLERHLELAFEGSWLHDAKRTQKNLGGFNWDSPKLVLPVPDRERKVNTNLSQNDGYGN